MTTTTAITTIGPGQRIEFGTGKMFTAGAAMAASAKDPYLVNEVCFLHFKSCGAKVRVIQVVTESFVLHLLLTINCCV